MPTLSEVMRKFEEADKRRREQRQITEVDKARVIFWLHDARMRAGMRRPHGLEHLAKPTSFGRNEDGLPYHSSLFAKYGRGIHRPLRSTIDKVEAVVPGSKKIIEHVLWKALATNEKFGERAGRWLRELDPAIQLIVFKRGEDVLALRGERYLGTLERRASLDALAALTILARLHLERGHAEQAWHCALATYRVLLMLGDTFNKHEVAPLMLQLFKDRIFDAVRRDRKRLDITSSDFVDKALALYDMGKLLASERHDSVTWHHHVDAMRRLLSNRYRFEWYFWLRPREIPDGDIGPAAKVTLAKCRLLQRAHDWGQRCIQTRTYDRDIPETVFHEPLAELRMDNEELYTSASMPLVDEYDAPRH